jgi:hypothetical protein
MSRAPFTVGSKVGTKSRTTSKPFRLAPVRLAEDLLRSIPVAGPSEKALKLIEVQEGSKNN